MTQPVIEFLVVNTEVLSDRVRVEGRCSYGPIAKGAKFNAILELKTFVTPEAAGPSERTLVAQVDLRVVSIFMYGRYVDDIPRALSGRLEIQGNGIQQIRDGLALSFIEPENKNAE